MNVSDVVSVEVKSNKIKTLELEELSYFDKIRKLDLEDNQIQFIKNAKRKPSQKTRKNSAFCRTETFIKISNPEKITENRNFKFEIGGF